MESTKARVGQRHRKAGEWREIVTAWKASGVSKKAWCQNNGIAYDSLRRWVKRIPGYAEGLSLVEVKPSGVVPAEVCVLVHPSGGVELRGAVTEELLRWTVRAVREPCHVS